MSGIAKPVTLVFRRTVTSLRPSCAMLRVLSKCLVESETLAQEINNLKENKIR